MSGEESSEGEDEEEGEFEAVDARALVNNGSQIPEIEKKKKLHEMEVGEAQALFSGRKNSIASVDSTGSLPGGVAVDKEEDGEEE
jgi:hypothetical protein